MIDSSIPRLALPRTVWCLLLGIAALGAADLPPEVQAASDERLAEIPLGGDFEPDPQEGVFVAVGQGARVLVSRDDGATWQQVFYGMPAGGHSQWSSRSLAIGDGLIATHFGWGKPTKIIASDDGVNWRHLTSGEQAVADEDDPTTMVGTWGLAIGGGTVLATGYVRTAATSDFGKTWVTANLRGLKREHPDRALKTHHLKPVYCGDASGRFLAIGQDRSEDDPTFGNLFATDDGGAGWTWLEPTLLQEEMDPGRRQGYSDIASNGEVVVIIDFTGENAFISSDAGDSWEGPFATGAQGRRVNLSVVGDEFWLSDVKRPRASADGRSWRELPESVPADARFAGSEDTGSVIAIDRQRILHSTDAGETWTEVYSYEIPADAHVQRHQSLHDCAWGRVAPVSE